MSDTTPTPALSAPTSADRPLLEARSIDWVPENERHGKVWHQGPLWFLGNFQYFSIPIGFIGPSMHLSLLWTIVASILGIGFGTIFMAFHASQGPTMGLPQLIQSRAQFGYRGVIVPLIATLFTYLAFNVADTVLMSEGLNATFGWNATAVGIGVTVIGVTLAIFGHDWLHKAFRFLLYLSLPVMTILTIGVISGGAGGHWDHNAYGFTWAAFMAQFSASAAYNITYAPDVSDYSRYLPANTPARSVIAAVFFGASTAAIWLISLGAWLAIALGAGDGLAGLKLAGNTLFSPLGDVAAALSAAALTATMGMNAYGAMLTVLTTVDSVRPIKPKQPARIITIIVLAVVWYAVAKSLSSNSVDTVFASLTLMLYVLVPWTATNLVDFFFVRKGHYAIADFFTPNGIYGAWGRRGLIAFGVGFLSEIPFMVLPKIGNWSYVGPIAKHLEEVDIAWLVGLVVTGVVYLLLSRSIDHEAEAREEAVSQEFLEETTEGARA